MRRAETYREYAKQCLLRADRASESAERRLFSEMAFNWHEIAEVLEQYDERLARGDESRDNCDPPEAEKSKPKLPTRGH
jgi:hypothetical protein